MSNKQEQLNKLLTLAEKGGKDAELFLLDLINELKDLVEEKIELKKGDKGDKGEVGERGNVGERGEQGFNGNDGKNGIDGIDGVDGKDGIDGRNGIDGKDGSPDTVEDIVIKLESLEGDKRLDKSAIKGLKELEEKINKKSRSSFSMFGNPKRSIRAYNLTSQCNGVLKTFSMPTETIDVIGVFGTQYPINFAPIDDWTFNKGSNSVILGSSVGAPQTGQTLWVLYEKSFYE